MTPNVYARMIVTTYFSGSLTNPFILAFLFQHCSDQRPHSLELKSNKSSSSHAFSKLDFIKIKHSQEWIPTSQTRLAGQVSISMKLLWNVNLVVPLIP